MRYNNLVFMSRSISNLFEYNKCDIENREALIYEAFNKGTNGTKIRAILFQNYFLLYRRKIFNMMKIKNLPLWYGIKGMIFDLLGCLYTCEDNIGAKKFFSVGRYFPSFDFEYEKLSMWENRLVHKIEKCKGCKFALLCRGRCPRTEIEGLSNRNNENCQKFFEKYFSLYVKIFAENILKNKEIL